MQSHAPQSPEAAASASTHVAARQKQALPTPLSVPSFSAFRSQASHIPVLSPVRRKPLPFNASPRAASFSHVATARQHDAELNARPLSIDSPLPKRSSGLSTALSPPLTGEGDARDLEQSVPLQLHICATRISLLIQREQQPSTTYPDDRSPRPNRFYRLRIRRPGEPRNCYKTSEPATHQQQQPKALKHTRAVVAI